MVPADGRVARSGGRARRHRARDYGDRPAPRGFSARDARLLHRGLRGADGTRGARNGDPVNAPLKIPMPLRVPELASSLGRLLVPPGGAEPWVPLDDIREELATRVIELGGEARRAAAEDRRDLVLEAVSRR